MSTNAIGRRMFILTATAVEAFRRCVTLTAGRLEQSASVPPWQGVVLQSDEGQFLVSGRRRAPMRIKVNSKSARGATMSMLMSEVAPGASIPIHLHRNEDELIFIHSGEGIVTLGDERVPSRAGAVLYAPKG